MTEYVHIPLSEKRYRQLKRWAEMRQQEVGEAVADYLAATLLNRELPQVAPAGADPAVAREKAAYQQLHADLLATHLDKYVAIYGGKLIDHDSEFAALFERIDSQFADEFVLLTRVTSQPTRTLTFRSPRLVRDVP